MLENMHRIFGLSIALALICFGASETFARDSKQTETPKIPAVQESMVGEGAVASTDLGFAPDGLARDVMNLMTGIRKPIDESMNLTVQAGSKLRIGITF